MARRYWVKIGGRKHYVGATLAELRTAAQNAANNLGRTVQVGFDEPRRRSANAGRPASRPGYQRNPAAGRRRGLKNYVVIAVQTFDGKSVARKSGMNFEAKTPAEAKAAALDYFPAYYTDFAVRERPDYSKPPGPILQTFKRNPAGGGFRLPSGPQANWTAAQHQAAANYYWHERMGATEAAMGPNYKPYETGMRAAFEDHTRKARALRMKRNPAPTITKARYVAIRKALNKAQDAVWKEANAGPNMRFSEARAAAPRAGAKYDAALSRLYEFENEARNTGRGYKIIHGIN
jgi:hypothetical protein